MGAFLRGVAVVAMGLGCLALGALGGCLVGAVIRQKQGAGELETLGTAINGMLIGAVLAVPVAVWAVSGILQKGRGNR